MKRFLLFFALLPFGTVLWGQTYEPYIPEDEMPDVVKVLPAPPKDPSPEFDYDILRYEWGKQQRKDPARLQMAVRDAIWSLDTTLVILGEPFGLKISKEETPAIYNVLTRGVTTIENIRFRPKSYYFRTRPFAYFKEPSIFPQDDEWLATEGSYPSGHTIRAWACALLMAQINPDAAESVFARAWLSGESRVISGCHWQTDVDASRPVAGIGYSRLQTSGEFLRDMALARNEFQALTAGMAPLAQNDELHLRNWIQTISSDYFGGRKPMTEYETRTVNYLAKELDKMGLEPAFDGSWFQPFQIIAVTVKPEGNVLAVKGKKKARLKYPDDVVVWTSRATDRVALSNAEYVFCGFGIHAPEYGWDDYSGVDVKGKIVIAMVNDPGYYDPNLFRGRNMTYYGRWLYKFEEAIRRGAAGCLVLHNTEAASYGWHVCVNGHMEDNLALYNPVTRNAGELPVKGWLAEEGARKIFAAAGLDMDAAISAAKKPGFRSIPLKVKGDVKMDVSYHIEDTKNVGAIRPGTDKADELVVLCAHWDHLGIGTPDSTGDAIYNGAADNASGLAGALLSARLFTRLPERPRRSVLFLFPSSEESGLFGSSYYCSHPAYPMEKTVACLNFESIGPAELTRDLSVLGGGQSRLDRYFEAAAASQGRYIFYDDDNSDGWFFRSDHYNFVKSGVPAVVWENGTDLVDPSRPNKYPMPVWYHKPSDEYRPDWDLSGTLANVRLIFSVALSLSNTADFLK